jgi:hypothetical protein
MAAGLGFKTFTTGEVLTSADVNGYLMQGVLVFASAAARNAAITSPEEGQFAFTKDTNGLWYYDGAAWVASGATGDIEGVTAGVGISGGGTSGTVTVTNDMATTITAAGDIVVGTGSGTYDNLPIGTTAQVLTADTTVSPYKVKWATPAATGFVGCSLNNSSTNQSLSNATNTLINFDTEIFDTDAFHTGGSPTRVTIPAGKAGYYLVLGTVTYATNASGQRQCNILKNGGSLFANTSYPSGGIVQVKASGIINLAVADYIELQGYQDSGGSLNVVYDTPGQLTTLIVQYLGA